jgi:hypothetical protein
VTSKAAYEFAPRPWALVAFFVLSAAAAAVISFGLGMSVIIIIAVPAGGTWAFERSARVSLDRAGVRQGSSSCEWADIELRTSRWGRSLRTREGAPRSSRLRVFFPMYVSNWESHPVRDDLRRWAPHLSIPR